MGMYVWLNCWSKAILFIVWGHGIIFDKKTGTTDILRRRFGSVVSSSSIMDLGQRMGFGGGSISRKKIRRRSFTVKFTRLLLT